MEGNIGKKSGSIMFYLWNLVMQKMINVIYYLVLNPDTAYYWEKLKCHIANNDYFNFNLPTLRWPSR